MNALRRITGARHADWEWPVRELLQSNGRHTLQEVGMQKVGAGCDRLAGIEDLLEEPAVGRVHLMEGSADRRSLTKKKILRAPCKRWGIDFGINDLAIACCCLSACDVRVGCRQASGPRPGTGGVPGVEKAAKIADKVRKTGRRDESGFCAIRGSRARVRPSIAHTGSDAQPRQHAGGARGVKAMRRDESAYRLGMTKHGKNRRRVLKALWPFLTVPRSRRT